MSIMKIQKIKLTLFLYFNEPLFSFFLRATIVMPYERLIFGTTNHLNQMVLVPYSHFIQILNIYNKIK